MRRPHIPSRIPPLVWRKPAFVWTPLALGAAVGWPALALQQDGAIAQLALIVGATTFAIGLVTLGVGWMFGRPPRSYRTVILHVLTAGAIVALASPFVLTQILSTLAAYKDTASNLGTTSSIAMIPLALVLGLPAAFISGTLFGVVALMKPARRDPADDELFRHQVQPFV